MYILLISLVLGSFAVLLFVNFYFRWKVMKVYQRLVEQQIEFEAAHIFNQKKLMDEIVPRHPEAKEDILTFVRHIRFSISVGTVLLGLILLFGGILMYYR